MKTLIIIALLTFSVPCYASSTINSVIDDWSGTIRGKNESCPSVARAYVAKTFHTKDKAGFDTRFEISYEGWVRSITQENKVMTSVGLEF
jgi:hypothetical protein